MSALLGPRVSLDVARRTALAAQGFADPRPTGAVTRRHLTRVLERVRLLQIDSVNVVSRAHYLPLFSRLGAYPQALLDDAVWGPPGRRVLAEYWAHEASIVPLATWGLLGWRMALADDEAWGGMRRIGAQRPDYVAWVLSVVAEKGPVRAVDVEARTAKAGAWWDWHDAKLALEYLFWRGDVSTASRTTGFERRYDLTERVLPGGRPQVPAPADARRELLRQAASAVGVGTASDLRDYWRMGVADTRTGLDELVAAGELMPVQVAGWRAQAYRWHAARTPRTITGRALLAPFDPLVWTRDRTERLFGFRYRLEIYVPAAQRVHGYYVLPFLLDGELVARVDLKADRSAGVLLVQGAHLEAGQDPARVAPQLRAELEAMASWLALGAGVVVVGRGDLAGVLASGGPRLS